MAKWLVLWMFGNLEIQHLSTALFNLGGKYTQTLLLRVATEVISSVTVKENIALRCLRSS